MKTRSLALRKITNGLVKSLAGLSALLGIFFLGWILLVVAQKGLKAIDLNLFFKLPTPPGIPGGGLANAILGTFSLTLLATVMGVPVGLLAGVHLAEFGGQSLLAGLVRFATDVLLGVPSIIVGVFVYTIVVVKFGHFSGYAGALALGIIMLPVVARTTEEIMSLVPNSLREAALALGAPRWKMILTVVFRAARSGLITGGLLAIARVSGETAPLLFTALNSPYWTFNLGKPTANLTVTIFNYAMSPYQDWQSKAWGASLLITFAVLLVTIAVRAIFREKRG